MYVTGKLISVTTTLFNGILELFATVIVYSITSPFVTTTSSFGSIVSDVPSLCVTFVISLLTDMLGKEFVTFHVLLSSLDGVDDTYPSATSTSVTV